ncbi:MAG TPA: FAD-binding oxidoreductase [Porticoccus sp.]|nr:FAD-binding oxidoreductase [Porticoccus sp.]
MNSFLDKIQTLVGLEGLLMEGSTQRVTDGWGARECQASAIIRPANTAELSEVMKLCHESGQKVVTHGGCTNMTRGCAAGEHELVISLERMTTIEAIDTTNRTMTVQAGVPLQVVQENADANDLFFALDLGARGTATIGGNIATNAGGNQVIRYGMVREQVLGLEVVLADGRILSSMNQMLKNNAGYDLKHLFIGSEGTLGIITRAVLRLRPKMPVCISALVATDQFSNMAKLLNHMEKSLGGALSAFETMWHSYYAIACRTNHMSNDMGKPPLPDNYPLYILIEATGAHQESDSEQFLQALDTALSEGLITDAVLAESGQQQQAMWAIRDNIPALMSYQPLVLFDISLPISGMESYLEDMQKNLNAISNNLFVGILGHLGDGNLHVAVQLNEDSTARKEAVEHAVYAPLQNRGGSISGEHGIGLEKKPYLHFSRNETEIDVMRQLKQLFDPKCLLNCGKVL